MKNLILHSDISDAVVKLKITNLSILFILAFIACGMIIGCSNINEPAELDKETLIAFAAIYKSDSGNISKLVIADYNNPKNFKIVSSSEINPVEPVFSYNKEKILFGLHGRLADGYQFAVYDINTGKVEELYANNIYEGAPAGGGNPIWDLNNNGFYFTQDHTYSIAKGIYYYDLTTKEITELYNPQDASVYVIGLKSPDTLIVFSNRYILESNANVCYFYMSKSGEYLDTVKNQQLGHYTRWNYKNKQFVYSAYSNSVYAISITDIEGTLRNQYTNSHYDTRPVWGPGNTIILFNRQTEDDQKEQLYLVDTVTGNVQQYIDPAAINGADQIIDAAY